METHRTRERTTSGVAGCDDSWHLREGPFDGLVENFTLFSEHKAGLVKIIGQNHQYLGVNNAIASMLEARKLGHGRGGVFWQTQGSGKGYSMVFFAQKVLRKITGNWTFVVVTDRVELDDQIAKTFAACGAVTDAQDCYEGSGAHLRKLLGGIYSNAVIFNNAANSFSGDGTGLTALNASNLGSGTLPDTRLSANIPSLMRIKRSLGGTPSMTRGIVLQATALV